MPKDKSVEELYEDCPAKTQIEKMGEQLGDIHGLFFGNYDKPKNGLVMAVDKNTAFRKWAISVLLGAGVIGVLLRILI